MISSEKAFDILPYVSDIYEKVNINKYITDNKKQIKKGTQSELQVMGFGLDMFSYVMKNSPKIKEEFFNVVAIIEDKDLKEVKAQPLGNTLKTIKLLFEDIETMDFFKSAMK